MSDEKLGKDVNNCNHEHEHGDDCGCEHNTIVLTFDDDEEVECNIIGVFGLDDLEYIAINPIESDEVLIYRCHEDKEKDELQIDFIDDDEEYDRATVAFYEQFGLEEDDFVEYEEYADED